MTNSNSNSTEDENDEMFNSKLKIRLGMTHQGKYNKKVKKHKAVMKSELVSPSSAS